MLGSSGERERELNNKLQMLLVSYSGENIGFHALLEIHDHASKKPNNQHQMLVKWKCEISSLQDFQTPHEKNLQGQLMVCTEMKIQAVFCKQEKKRVSKSQVCCVHHYRKTAPNKSGQLSVVYIRWTFMGLEGAVNGVDRTRTFSI